MKASIRTIVDYRPMTDDIAFRLDVFFRNKMIHLSFVGQDGILLVPKNLNGCSIGEIDLDKLTDGFRTLAKEIDKASGRKRRTKIK